MNFSDAYTKDFNRIDNAFNKYLSKYYVYYTESDYCLVTKRAMMKGIFKMYGWEYGKK